MTFFDFFPYFFSIVSADGKTHFFSSKKNQQGDLNLNICEAHAFNTLDRFSLDVFVVNGWSGETADELEDVLSERLAQLPPPGAHSPPRGGGAGGANANAANANADSQQPGVGTLTPIGGAGGGGTTPSGVSPPEINGLVPTSALPRPPPPPDDFELDASEVVCHERVAAGAFGDLYRGTYCGTDVAVKILRNVATDTAQFAEFLQEVHIMRKVRHRNVVQFIGACTQRPNLCIVFEYLPGKTKREEGEEGEEEEELIGVVNQCCCRRRCRRRRRRRRASQRLLFFLLLFFLPKNSNRCCC